MILLGLASLHVPFYYLSTTCPSLNPLTFSPNGFLTPLNSSSSSLHYVQTHTPHTQFLTILSQNSPHTILTHKISSSSYPNLILSLHCHLHHVPPHITTTSSINTIAQPPPCKNPPSHPFHHRPPSSIIFRR